MKIGDMVRVLEPFNEAFPLQYEIIEDCGTYFVLKDAEAPNFDPRYLEVIT